jgi:hypothetical protein
MAVNRDKAHEIRSDGLSFENGGHISFESGVPTHAGLVGDRYYNSTDGTEWVLEANGSVWIPKRIIKRLTVAQTTTVVAPAALTGLTTQSLPVGYYKFYTIIKIRSAASNNGYGLRFQNVSATVSDILAQWRLPSGADFSNSQNDTYSQRILGANDVTKAIGSANTDYTAIGEGFFNVSVAGTVTIQFRSETAGTVVTAGIGSFLEVVRL